MATILLNGLIKDYAPPGGIASYGVGGAAMVFDPTAQAWTTGRAVACPQGDSGGLTIPYADIGNVPFDGGFSPRAGQGDDGFYATVVSTVGGRFFSTNLKAKGTTGSAEPSASGVDGSLVWVTATSQGFAYRGARANSTAYVSGDLILQGSAIWRCVVGGTSSGSLPAGYGTAQYGGTVSDGGAFFVKFLVAAGAWTALTSYVGAQPQDTNQHLVAIGLTTVNGAFLIFDGVRGTNGTTGGAEPAWTAASGTQKYWADNDIVWIQGKDLFGGANGANQTERLVLTGLAAGTNGQLVTISNTGGATTDVVIADKTGAVNPGLVGSDMESAATNKFDGLGANIRIPGGSSADFKYSTATGFWVYQPSVPVVVEVLKGGTVPGVYAKTVAPTGTTGNNTHNLGGAAPESVDADGLVAQLNVEAVGATPTLTWVLEGSVDGSNWFTCPYIDNASDTPAFAATVVTAVGQYLKFFWLAPGSVRFFRFFRVRTTANTNVTYSCVVAWQERADQ